MNHKCSAWHPGLESDIPPAYRKLETIYRPENTAVPIEYIEEISAQTGLNSLDLVVFRPERLVLHELIVRVTADILVHEGQDENELGRNFRRICKRILSHYIQPRMGEVARVYDELQKTLASRARQELGTTLFNADAPKPIRKRFFLFSQRKNTNKEPPPRLESVFERESRAIVAFKEKGLTAEDPLSKALYRGLYIILGTIAGNRGFLGPDPEFLTTLVCNHACNNYGSKSIGKILTPWIAEAIDKEGYSTVPNADKPLLISLKGASAAGKSSLRPMVSKTMCEQGMVAHGYATISPDIWRRLLLDYGSLGPAYKYAGRLTGQEVLVVDGKLDRYIRDKAKAQGAIPHILVDRFRFDSFSTERVSQVLHDTYVKHVDTMYMYFVVTPPHATVERGWERGLQTGRYKAVEDYLDHSVEAYVGMPKILFKWLASDVPSFKYEFLDNSVTKGTYPKTIAFGTRDEINIVDCSVFVDIERYQKINIRAKTPRDVYVTGAPSSVANNVGFLRQCIRKIPSVNFVDEATGTTYLKVLDGKFTISDKSTFARQIKDREKGQVFAELASSLSS